MRSGLRLAGELRKHQQLHKWKHKYKEMLRERQKTQQELKKLKEEKSNFEKQKQELERLRAMEQRMGTKFANQKEKVAVGEHALQKGISARKAREELHRTALQKQVTSGNIARKDIPAIQKMSRGMVRPRIMPPKIPSAGISMIERLAEKIAKSPGGLASLNKHEIVLYNRIMRNKDGKRILNRRYEELVTRGY